MSLVEAIETALRGGKPMRVGDIVDAVQGAGYRSNSDNFRGIVNQTLIKERGASPRRAAASTSSRAAARERIQEEGSQFRGGIAAASVPFIVNLAPRGQSSWGDNGAAADTTSRRSCVVVWIEPSCRRITRWQRWATVGSCVTRMIVLPAATSSSNSSRICWPGLAVQRTGRLVGQQDQRVVDHRAGDADALLLAAGKLHRAGGPRSASPTRLGQLHRAPAPLGRRDAQVEHRHFQVLQHRELLDEVEVLEDEPDAAAADLGELVVVAAG